MKKLWLLVGICMLFLVPNAFGTMYFNYNYTQEHLQDPTGINFTNHSHASWDATEAFQVPANRTIHITGQAGSFWGHLYFNYSFNGFSGINLSNGNVTWNISMFVQGSGNSAACNGFGFYIQNETSQGNGEAMNQGYALGYDHGASQLKLWACTGSSSRSQLASITFDAPRNRQTMLRIRMDKDGQIEVFADGNATALFNVTNTTYINDNSIANFHSYTGGISTSAYWLYSNLSITQGESEPLPDPAGPIFATDAFDKQNITHWNLTAYNGTNISVFTTTNGTISPNLTGNYTFNFTHGDYFIYSVVHNMTNESLNLTPHQAVMVMEAQEIFSNVTLSDASNFTTLTQSAIGPDQSLLVKTGIINITFIRDGYHQKHCEFNVSSALSNQSYTCIDVATSKINITARGLVSAKSTDNFSITIYNSTNSYNYTTENGTIEVPTINGTYNINFSSPDAYSINNNNYLVENFSQELEFSTSGANVTIIVLEKVTGNNVTGGNITTLNFTTENRTFLLDAGAQNITINRSPYLVVQQEFNITGGTTNTITFNSLVTGQVNVSVQNNGGSSITDYNITLTYINSTVTFNEIDITTNGSIILGLINGSYNFTLESANQETRTGNFTLNTSLLQLNFTLFAANSISFTFRDEVNDNLIDFENITVELISDLLSLIGNTTNGTLALELLQPTNYTMRVDADSYEQKFYQFELLPNAHGELTLYLLNSTQSSNVTVEVIDNAGQPVENAKVEVLRYQISTNSYVQTESVLTGVDGKNIVRVQKNAEFYKFIISTNGIVRLETSPAIVTADSITFQITLGDAGAENFFRFLNISQALTFNEDTYNFKYTFTDNDLSTSQVCLDVVEVGFELGDAAVNKTCTTAKTATILIPVTNVTGKTYKATATATIGNDEVFMSELYYTFRDRPPFQEFGLFMTIVLMIIFGMTAAFNPMVAAIFTPFPLLLAAGIGLVNIPVEAALIVQVLGILIAYFVSDKT